MCAGLILMPHSRALRLTTRICMSCFLTVCCCDQECSSSHSLHSHHSDSCPVLAANSIARFSYLMHLHCKRQSPHHWRLSPARTHVMIVHWLNLIPAATHCCQIWLIDVSMIHERGCGPFGIATANLCIFKKKLCMMSSKRQKSF
jgi:hypothetical protein